MPMTTTTTTTMPMTTTTTTTMPMTTTTTSTKPTTTITTMPNFDKPTTTITTMPNDDNDDKPTTTKPTTAIPMCADDDAFIVELAQGVGLTIGGCVDVLMFCDHPMYGSTVQATCPATCDSCTGGQRLADRKDLNAGALDGIQELTVVAPRTHAAAAEVRQNIEESSSSDTNLFIP